MLLSDIEEEWPERLTPKTEREPQTERQRQWAEHGFIVERDVFDEDTLVAYEQEWLAYNGGDPSETVLGDPRTYTRPGGWPYATPYMKHDALRRVVCDGRLGAILAELTGEPMGVHLNLTGWVSTRRDWHRDQYLNEPGVGDFYAAVWIALDTVRLDAGPFELIPGSHKARPISQTKMRAALGTDGYGPDWPTHSERILTPLFDEAVQAARASGRIKQFIAQRGEVLIWHGRLLHRGSTPNDPTLERRSLIAHYSGVNHRPDMPRAVQHDAGGWFFPLHSAPAPTGYYKREAEHLT